MDRYCISHGKEDAIYEDKLNGEAKQGFKIRRHTMLRVIGIPIRVFREDFSKIIWEINVEGAGKEEDVSEEEMYRSVLISILTKPELIKLDMFLHTYYTLLYEKNKGSYVPLVGKGWEKFQKDEMREKRNNYRTNGGGKRGLPFKIVEKKNGKSVKGRENEETKIPDFAPDAIRLAYLSIEFRTLFKDVKKEDAEKFGYSEIQKIFEGNAELIAFNRKEEIWLEERLLAVNLAWAFHSFFYPIFQNMTFAEVQRDFQELMEGIIHEVMKWEGLYSRIELIRKLKIIYEIRTRAVYGRVQILPEKIPDGFRCVVTGTISDIYAHNDTQDPIYDNMEGETCACQDPEDQ